MNNNLSHFELARIVELAAELGAISALIETGRIKPYLNKSEAFREYGRSNIIKWIEKGMIVPLKDGNHSAAYRIDRLEIETIKKCYQLLKMFL
ncbi:hypothetical protein [Pedobacter mucosus]|uniref:hypothetical protein n=1 Tax=Pedobacter mucosus TaxID=2895286 RepID=UPI001EE4D67A|nr:hypothetical protein [Pedobacter mucosus]UKT65103.1 hypothetical protein LOK61_04825 [Pedobacter mucosus]